MKFKNIFLITIIILAILSISAVSAADDLVNDEVVSADSDGDVISVDEESSILSEEGNASISSSDLTKYYKNDSQYHATFFDFDGNPIVNKNVSIYVNGITYHKPTDENGTATLGINLAPGTYPIKVTNPVTNETAENNIYVLPTIKAIDVVKYYKNGTQYEVYIVDGQGNPLKGGEVNLNINGIIYKRTTGENGIASLDINLPAGKYVITAERNGEKFASNITVLHTINASNVVKYYKNGTQYEVNVVDGQGNPLANETVSLNINGIIYKRTTDENGTAHLDINLPSGKYIITAGRDNGERFATNITVLPTVQTKDIKLYYKNGTQYEVTVVDGQGNPLSDVNVTLNVNGRMYNRTTDENGTARLDINLPPGTYIVTAKNPVTGEFGSSKVQVLNRIVCKNSLSGQNVSLEYKNGAYKVELHEKNGTLAANQTVTFNINGRLYNKTSDSKGIASLDINLLPGNYIITAEYDGCKLSNLLKVRVTPSIKVLTSTIKSGDYIQFRLTEKNTGNPITGNHLGIIYFNESAYGVYPDSDGVCKIRAYLPVGSYLFYFMTLDDGWYSTITTLNTIKFTE